MRIAVATCAALSGLNADEKILLRALRARGYHAEPVVWEEPLVDWSEWDLVLVRLVWDYCFRREAFLDWAAHVATRTLIYNPPAMLRWNTHKEYFLDLERAGVPVVPTVLCRSHERVELAALMASRGWSDVVVKPAVAQSGRLMARAQASSLGNLGNLAEGQAHLDRLLGREDALVQPFIGDVLEHGEVSLVFIASEYTHAVRKTAAGDELRVHDDHGGLVERWEPDERTLAVARQALAACDRPPLYARVDIVHDRQRGPLLMELELTEPELFFRFAPEAAERLATAVAEF